MDGPPLRAALLRLDWLLLRDHLAGRPIGGARSRGELRYASQPHRVVSKDLLPEHAALLDARLHDLKAATIRHAGVVFRIANGDVYGWEGSNGSCFRPVRTFRGYAQSLAWLFPDLERIMRRIELTHQQRPDGGINTRTEVPSPPHPSGQFPFTDGHAACVLRAYREARNCPDDSFFRGYWPQVKRAVEYLIHRDAVAGDGVPDGTLKDVQWNTHDQSLHGVTAFLSGYYLLRSARAKSGRNA